MAVCKIINDTSIKSSFLVKDEGLLSEISIMYDLALTTAILEEIGEIDSGKEKKDEEKEKEKNSC